MNNQLPTVALAILYQNQRFLMQLRDDIPGIMCPGQWGFFGGHIESGETPESALKRELLEEINYAVEAPVKFRCNADANAIRHIYHAPLTVPIDHLQLNEGFDLGLVTPDEIRRGSCYSRKADGEKPMGQPHQQILLDFLETNLWQD